MESTQMANPIAKNRLFLMDDIKLLASYFVVFIHFMLPGDLGDAVKAVARFAVPFFFMCSGYFSYGNTPEIIRKKALHILKLFLIATMIYAFLEIGVLILEQEYNQVLVYFLYNFFNTEKWIKCILFNVPPICTFLWYLLAMFYVYLIYYFVTKFNIPDRGTDISSIILLVLHLVIWHSFLVYEITDDTFYVRNFLFVGYPFVTIGRMLKKHQDKLPQLKAITISLLLIIGSICSILSCFAFGSKSLPFGAIVISITLMLVCITTKQPQKPIIVNAGIYSMYIYLFHRLIKKWYFSILSATSMTDTLFEDLSPFVICIATTIFAIICTKIQKNIVRVFPSKQRNH